MLGIDLNCDLGESFGAYTLGLDEEVIRHVTSVNIACGWHAGDPLVLRKTIALAKEHGVSIGAHPGFPDLLGFGRRNMSVSKEEARDYTTYQLGAFYGFAHSVGLSVQHVKPHGAFYNMAGKDMELALGICEAIYSFDKDIILLALAGSCMVKAAAQVGLRVASEFFADRAYEDDGSLVARSKPGAVIHDEALCISRVVQLAKTGTVTSLSGKEIPLEAHSICVHGDNPSAVQFVESIRHKLSEEGINVLPLNQLV